MGEVKTQVDALIAKLNHVSEDVRLQAVEELCTIDKEHALPALHWAIENDLDDRVRNAARDAYQKLSRAKAAEATSSNGTTDKTRSVNRPHVKVVQVEEGFENPCGRLSFQLSLGVVLLVFVWLLLDLGQGKRDIPFFTWWLRVSMGLAGLGLGLGIIGVARRGEKHIPAIVGTVVNGIIFLVYFLTTILPWIRGLFS